MSEKARITLTGETRCVNKIRKKRSRWNASRSWKPFHRDRSNPRVKESLYKAAGFLVERIERRVARMQSGAKRLKMIDSLLM